MCSFPTASQIFFVFVSKFKTDQTNFFLKFLQFWLTFSKKMAAEILFEKGTMVQSFSKLETDSNSLRYFVSRSCFKIIKFQLLGGFLELS